MTVHEKQRRRRPRSHADGNKTNGSAVLVSASIPSHARRRQLPMTPTFSATSLSASTINAPRKMSHALAACWSSLLLPSIRLPSSASSSVASSAGPTSRTPTLTPSSYMLTDPLSAPSPRVVHTTKHTNKQPRLAGHTRLRRLAPSDDTDNMPRRKRRTERLHLEVPALADAAERVLMAEAGAISPRSIRSSLEETNVDMDGHVRQPRKGSVSLTTTLELHHNGAAQYVNGSSTNGSANGHGHNHSHHHTTTPADDDHVITTDANASAMIGPAEPDFYEDEEPPVEYSANPAVPANDAVLAQLTGAQLWVHRLLATHHHTLRELGLELEAFPNTRLSLKQIEAVMSPVITMCNYMTPAQFGIREPSPTMARVMAEVHYWKLWESDSIDIGIFFIPPGGVIPLHNHPGMSVVTRVLYGSANVTSYDLVPKAQLTELPADDVQAGQDDIKWARVSRQGEYVAECTMWLDPRRFNLHHIRANDQIGCALLDIMIPPYNNADRDCHHFEILVERLLEKNQDRIVKLLESVQPDNHNEPSVPTSGTTSSSSATSQS